MLSAPALVVGTQAVTPSDVRELLRESELAQAQLEAQLAVQAAQIAQLTRDLDAVQQQPRAMRISTSAVLVTDCRPMPLSDLG